MEGIQGILPMEGIIDLLYHKVKRNPTDGRNPVELMFLGILPNRLLECAVYLRVILKLGKKGSGFWCLFLRIFRFYFWIDNNSQNQEILLRIIIKIKNSL